MRAGSIAPHLPLAAPQASASSPAQRQCAPRPSTGTYQVRMMRPMSAALYSCRKLLMPEVSTTSATPSPAGSRQGVSGYSEQGPR